MQSAHQTFITVGISTAILLGVTDVSSAQEYGSSSLPSNRETVTREMGTAPPTWTPQMFETANLASPEHYTFRYAALPNLENSTRVEFSAKSTDLDQPVFTIADAEADVPLAQAIEVELSQADLHLAQAIEVELSQIESSQGEFSQEVPSVIVPGIAPEREEPNVDATVESDLTAASETEVPDLNENTEDSVDIEAAEPSTIEAEVAQEIEAEVAQEIEIEAAEPDDLTPESSQDVEVDTVDVPSDIDSLEPESVEPGEPETIENAIEATEDAAEAIEEDAADAESASDPSDSDGDRSDPFANDDLLDEFADKPPVEIPDYLLAPANPLFVPVEPETVEIDTTQAITLEEALEAARLNSRELQASLQQLEQAEEALRQQRAAYLPSVRGQTTFTRNDVDLSEETPGFDGELPTTVNADLDALVRVDYDIFTSGQRSASVRAAEKAVESQQLQVEVVKEDLRLNITTAYYDLQESDELVRIGQDTVEQSRISLRDAQAREDAGVGTRFDRLQAEVDLANDEQALSNALRDQQITRRQLAELLSIPPGVNISAADPVQVAGSWATPLEETLVLAYRNRAELEQQLLQRELEQQQERATRAGRWPQLSAFAQYNLNDLIDDPQQNEASEVFSIGLQIDWQIYNGGATRAAARQEAISAELAETQFADTREDIRFEVEQQYLSLGASFKNIQTANSAVSLAKESLRLARLRFGAGVGIQSDVLEAQTRLTQAEVNLVTAILDYNRALVAIQRAVSNLPDNNLSADAVRER